jgi:hypothetical protein
MASWMLLSAFAHPSFCHWVNDFLPFSNHIESAGEIKWLIQRSSGPTQLGTQLPAGADVAHLDDLVLQNEVAVRIGSTDTSASA